LSYRIIWEGDGMRDDDFRDFVRARSPALSRTAYLLTGDRHLAQDLLQSALAKTYQHWPRVRDGNPEAYVLRSLAPHLIDDEVTVP
jgi:DNA-directed RNA polymerase specialized sigma24 family protein